MIIPWKLVRVLALVFAALGIVACNDSSSSKDEVPPDAVARVGDTVVTKKDVRSFLPPGAATPEARHLAPQNLIIFEWLKRDAQREHVDVPTSMIESAIGRANVETPTARRLAEFALLRRQLIRKVTTQPTDEEVARYYHSRPRQFARREVRVVRLVSTDSQARASAAKQALQSGESWAAVLDRYSISDRFNARTVPYPPSGTTGVIWGEVPYHLSDALFNIRKGEIGGPVKSGESWYAFEVTRIDRLRSLRLSEYRESIRRRLFARRHNQAGDILQRRLRDRYRPITICNPERLLSLCRNGSPLKLDPSTWFNAPV